MSVHKNNTLNFEQKARGDIRIWLAFAGGCILVAVCMDDLANGGDFFQVAQGPIWLTVFMFACGLGMAVLGAICLIFNINRGCIVDEKSQELIWWQMKFSSQSLRGKARIDLRQVGVLRIDNSGDSLDISLYDTNGQKQDTFCEAVIPPDYDRWVGVLVEKWPHIQVERV